MRIGITILVVSGMMAQLHATPRGDAFLLEGDGHQYAQVLPEAPAGWREESLPYAIGRPAQQRGRERAFIFSCVPEEELMPYASSCESQRLTELTIISARGEYETATFGVYAFEPLHDLTVKVSGLRLPCDVRHSSWLWIATDAHAKRCRPLEVALVRGACDLKAHCAVRFWITVWVKTSVRPKVYRGIVTVHDASGIITRFPIKVRVLPITLPDPPLHYAFWYGPTWEWGYDKRIGKHFEQMREYGLTSVIMANIPPELSIAPGGTIRIGFKQIDKVADAFMRAGMRGPIVLDMRWVNGWCSNYGRAMEKANGDVAKVRNIDGGYRIKPFPSDYTRKAFMHIVKSALEHARERGWGQVWFYVQEEATNESVRIEQLRYFAPLLREAGAKALLVSNALWWRPHDESTFIGDYWDIRSYNFFTDDVVKRARNAKRQLAGFNLLGGYRRSAGFYAMRVGLTHVSFWAYQWGKPFPNDNGLFRNWFFALPSADGPIPTRRLVLLREGIDDARYVAALTPEQRRRFVSILQRRIPLDTPSIGLSYQPTNGERECHALRMLAIKMLLNEEALEPVPEPNPPLSLAPMQNLLRNGDMEDRKWDNTPARWYPQFDDLPTESYQLHADAAMRGNSGLRLRCSEVQEPRNVYLRQAIPNANALRGKTLRLTCHFRIRDGQGLLAMRVRCWRDGKWIGDVCRIWVSIRSDEVLIEAWQRNRPWGRLPLERPRGRWVEASSQGIVPFATQSIDVFFGISASKGEKLEVDLDECRVEVMKQGELQIIPAWNIATHYDVTLPLFIHFPAHMDGKLVQLKISVDGRRIWAPFAIRSLGVPVRLEIPIGELAPGQHCIAVNARSINGDRARASATFTVVSAFDRSEH